MHARQFLHTTIALLLTITVGCGGDDSTTIGDDTRLGVWGSTQADLTTKDSSTTIEYEASGGCVGSFGDIATRLPIGAFTFAGTYTQLIGAFPGKIVYGAEFIGTASANSVTMTTTVADLQQTIGPITMSFGENHHRAHCLYP